MSDEGSRVILWAIPRSSSTVFSLSVSRIPDVEMWMEPYGFARIAELNAKSEEGVALPRDHNGNEELYEKVARHVSVVMGRSFDPETLSYQSVKERLERTMAKHVFVKDMSYGMTGDDVTRYIPRGFRHSFLIRSPDLVYPGVHKAYFNHFKAINRLLPDETNEASFDLRNHNELGYHEDYYKSLHDLWRYVIKEVDPEPVVLDSTDLLKDPCRVLPRWCEAVRLPFHASMLSWPSTGVQEIGKWNWGSNWTEQHSVETFHAGVLRSTSFNPPKIPPPREHLTNDVIALAEAAMPFYNEMYQHRLRVDDILS
ncbi:uncharacterized protein LOC121427484 [Lytechinus variegatus]|uniref:uncharacterized protein LOC121427484 n=1 Tax=Lytechinus variegatus TaxID=7654 RepID=UPI001BB0F8CA|nr:uncharacterized protein LOC121427484 [Lytechinus variegatus]